VIRTRIYHKSSWNPSFVVHMPQTEVMVHLVQ